MRACHGSPSSLDTGNGRPQVSYRNIEGNIHHMDSIEEKLAAMGLTLPPAFVYPNNNRTGCVEAGHLLFCSGHPPPVDFGVIVHGKVGGTVTEEQAVEAARATALSLLSSVKQQLGSLDRIKQVVKLTGMVNTAPGFDRQFAVIDGASDFYCELFGPEVGQHARSAVGMFELPRGFCMEIEAIFEIVP
jgi:enamine deaminase RidA (YjgF/YER057c/UK114 family)